MKKKIIILIAFIFVILGLIFYFTNNNIDENNTEISSNETNSKGNDDSDELEYFVLYNGFEISPDMEVQYVTDGMDLNSENEERYNITYYNFEDGNYIGTSDGNFSEETGTYDGIAYVGNVNKFAFSEYYDATPYEYTSVDELPEELEYLAEYTSVNIEEIDLDGNGESEYIICYTYEKSEDETEDGEPIASSYIMLLNSNYEKVANLVSLENGYWANIKDPIQKVLLSLENDVEYIDIDNDGIMEIIINIPIYEGTKISTVKYYDGNILGETNIETDLLP